MFVEAEIAGSRIENAIVIPRTALRGSRVLIVDDESRLRFRDVNVLRVDREFAVIVGGLEEGDLVCVSTIEAVTDGMKVRASGGGTGASDNDTSAPDSTRETANAGGSQ